MSAFPDDEFVSDDLDYGEHPKSYYPGGLHPVHIDDLLDGDRYQIVHKLWLRRFLDRVAVLKISMFKKYVALKDQRSQHLPIT